MANHSPKGMREIAQRMANAISTMSTKEVAVGLPSEEAAGAAYKNGMSVIAVGIIHEYGFGNQPRRSFLRDPILSNLDKLGGTINQEWFRVVRGQQDAVQGLQRVGTQAANISRRSFRTGGGGAWPDITDRRKKQKGSSKILIDKGLLRGSITHVVR